MNHFKLVSVSAFFLVLAIGIGILNGDDRTIAVVFADGLELSPLNPIDDVPNDYQNDADPSDDNQNDENPDASNNYDDEFRIDDFSVDKSQPEIFNLVKYLLKNVLDQIPGKLHLNGTIRYQDNRFWNVTFLNKSDTDVLVHCLALANLEHKNSFTAIDSNQAYYKPLPGQYYIEAEMKIDHKNLTRVSTELINVTRVADLSHLDGVQVSILNGALIQIQKKLVLKMPVRYGRYLTFKLLSNHPVFGQRIQVGVILEKKSIFCEHSFAIPCSMYVPLHEKTIDSIYNIDVKKRLNGKTKLISVDQLDFAL